MALTKLQIFVYAAIPAGAVFYNNSGSHQSSTPSQTGPASSATVNQCKFGRKCHRTDCYFLHPDGRDVDDAEQQEIFRHIDEANGNLSDTDEFICPCCKNNSQSCNTPQCKERGGICGCEFGSDNKQTDEYEDDEGGEHIVYMLCQGWAECG